MKNSYDEAVDFVKEKSDMELKGPIVFIKKDGMLRWRGILLCPNGGNRVFKALTEGGLTKKIRNNVKMEEMDRCAFITVG